MIKPSHKGRFTHAAKEHGESVKQFENEVLSAPKGKFSPALRKEANFARNFGH